MGRCSVSRFRSLPSIFTRRVLPPARRTFVSVQSNPGNHGLWRHRCSSFRCFAATSQTILKDFAIGIFEKKNPSSSVNRICLQSKVVSPLVSYLTLQHVRGASGKIFTEAVDSLGCGSLTKHFLIKIRSTTSTHTCLKGGRVLMSRSRAAGHFYLANKAMDLQPPA